MRIPQLKNATSPLVELKDPKRLERLRGNWLKRGIFVLIALSVLFAGAPLLQYGWFGAHDMPWHLERVMGVSFEMKHGDFYPRWLSAGCFGKGLPVLNYYSPLLYLVIGAWHSLGLSLAGALKLTCFSLFFLGAAGMYRWVRGYCDVPGALVSCTIYTFLPYHFLDIYVRGALPEFAALALLPWLLRGIDLCFDESDYLRGILLTAVISALTILTHNLSAFIIAPFAALYFAFDAFSRKADLRAVSMALLGPLLGVGLSSFYWLPMLVELRYLGNFTNATVGAYPYYDHFVSPLQWFSPSWGFSTRAGGADGMSFQLGYALLFFVALSAISTAKSGRTESRRFAFITLVLGGGSLLLTTKFSAPLYKVVSGLQFIQFPWRYLGVSTLFLSAFSGLSTGSRTDAPHRYKAPALLAVAVVMCLLFSSTHRAVKQVIPVDLDEVERFAVAGENLGGMGAENEYLPKWATDSSLVPRKAQLEPFLASLSSNSRMPELHGGGMRFLVDAIHSGTAIVIPVFYFPGWQAEIDGHRADIAIAHGGLISLGVPQGEHLVKLWFGTTWPRTTGWVMSGIALILVVVLAGRRRSLNVSRRL
jgi:hypothetical protein